MGFWTDLFGTVAREGWKHRETIGKLINPSKPSINRPQIYGRKYDALSNNKPSKVTLSRKEHYACETETYKRVVNGKECVVVMPKFTGPKIDLGYDYNNPEFWKGHLKNDSGGQAQITAALKKFRELGYDTSGKTAHHLPSNAGRCHMQLVDTAEHKREVHYGGMSANNDVWVESKIDKAKK